MARQMATSNQTLFLFLIFLLVWYRQGQPNLLTSKWRFVSDSIYGISVQRGAAVFLDWMQFSWTIQATFFLALEKIVGKGGNLVSWSMRFSWRCTNLMPIGTWAKCLNSSNFLSNNSSVPIAGTIYVPISPSSWRMLQPGRSTWMPSSSCVWNPSLRSGFYIIFEENKTHLNASSISLSLVSRT